MSAKNVNKVMRVAAPRSPIILKIKKANTSANKKYMKIAKYTEKIIFTFNHHDTIKYVQACTRDDIINKQKETNVYKAKLNMLFSISVEYTLLA
jgi:hypothetical protein